MEVQKWGMQFQQRVIFTVLFFGYMAYIMDRKSFAFVIPSITETERLEKESIGSVLSALAIGYALGKFISGILVDTYSPKNMFSMGLIICGGINIVFSIVSSTASYSFLWFLNGLFQGFGWPSCGKLLRRWYSKQAFGTLWSLLSTSMNVAASIGPYTCNKMIDHYGSWRYCMRGFGIVSFIAALFTMLLVQDEPSTTTSPSNLKSKTSGKDSVDNSSKSQATFAEALQRILASPFTWVMALGFFVSLLCKATVCDWGPLYITTEKQATKASASQFSGTLEIGGITGSILSGFITDWIVSIWSSAKGQPRNVFLIPCTITLAMSMFLLRTAVSDVTEQHTFTMLLAFMIGFSMYAIISVIGVITIESSAMDISGRSHAVAALFGNVGLASGGLPFSAIIRKYSWSSAFFVIECSVMILASVLILSQMMNCRIGDLKKKKE